MKQEFIPSEKSVEEFKKILADINMINVKREALMSSIEAIAEKMLRVEGVKDEAAKVNYDSQNDKFFFVTPEEEKEEE